MILTKEDLNKFDVVEGTETGVIVSDGLMQYDVEITNDDILDILVSKFNANKDILVHDGQITEKFLNEYELHEDDVVREYLKNDFWDFKTAVKDFYDDINIVDSDDFDDFNRWCYNYHNYELCMDNNEKGLCKYYLKQDSDGLDSFTIFEDMDINYFDKRLHHFDRVLNHLQNIQENLTINAKDYRKKYLNDLNNELSSYGLQPVEIKKYNDEKDVLDIIKTINSKNDNLTNYLNEHKNNHILSDWSGNVEIWLERDEDGHYYTCDVYDEEEFGDYDDGTELVDNVFVPINRILSTDDIIYQPSLKECQEIDDKFSYKNKRHDYDWER